MNKDIRGSLIAAVVVIFLILASARNCHQKNVDLQRDMAKLGYCWLPVTGTASNSWQPCSKPQ